MNLNSEKPIFAIHKSCKAEVYQCIKPGLLNKQWIPKDYVNVTQLLRAISEEVGKRKEWTKYAKTDSATEYLEALSEELNTQIEQEIETPFGASDTEHTIQPLVIVLKGGNSDEQGVYTHPLVAKHLAIWASPKLAVWAIKVIDSVIRADFEALTIEADEAQRKLQDQWLKIREAGKVTRLKLTDAIQSWYHRNPNGTTRPAHAMYAQTTDNIYKALWSKTAKQLEEYLQCDRHEVRNVIDSTSLAILERAEDRVIEFIEDDNIKPVDAVSAAGIRAKKDLPKSKLW